MITYLDAVDTMHTRGLPICIEDYIFATLITLGESPSVAYAIAHDRCEFEKHVGTEDENEYINSKTDDAKNEREKQNIVQLEDLIKSSFQSEIQQSALGLKDYKFSGQEAVQILNNILKNRIEDLETASVRDVVSVIKMLMEQGALETGDGGFARHFVQIFPKFNALCNNCGREFDCHTGIGAVCPHCGMQYHWDADTNKFIPQPQKL